MTSWLFTQVWLWSIAAFVLGVLINHVLFVRPLRRRLRVREEELAALEGSSVDERNVPEPESGPLDLFDEDVEPAEEWNRNRPWARSRFTRTAERPGADPRAGASRDVAEDGASTWVDPASRASAAEPDVAPLPPRSPVPDASVTGASVSGTSVSGTSVSGPEEPGTWTDSASRRTAPDTGSTPEVPGADGQTRGPAPVPATAGFERSATAEGGTETAGPVPVRETENVRYPVPAVHTARDQATDGAPETGAGDLSNDTANTWFQKSAVDGTNTASAGQPDTAADSEVAARTAQTWTGQLAPPIEHGSAESASSTAAVGSPAAPEDAGVLSSDSAPDTADPLPVRPATDASTDGAGSTDGSADLVSISSEPAPTETSDSAAAGNAPTADTATLAGTAVGSEAPADAVQHETAAAPEAATPAHVTEQAPTDPAPTEQALANPTPTDPPSANPTQLDEPQLDNTQLDNTQLDRTDGLPQRTPGAAVRPGPDGDIVSGHVGPLIKGHAASRQYHTPDSPAYEQIVADVWFRSTADAEQAGFRSWNGR